MELPSYRAFHVLWTKPYRISGKPFIMNDAEILTMVISALMWQKYNGTIKLYTDKQGYEFIRDQGLLGLWDDGIDTDVLENNAYPIDPEIFWAAGKLIALEVQTGPCVMLDTDLIVVRPIHDRLRQSAVTALHTEMPDPDVYLTPSQLKKPVGYKFPHYYNWLAVPSNTAFLYIRDDSFRDYYLKESMKFMFNNMEKPMELISQMVFAEQRMLSICAGHKVLPVNYLLSDPFSSTNQDIIHLWGFKSLLRKNERIQVLFAKQLLKTVGGKLSANTFLRHYLKNQSLYLPGQPLPFSDNTPQNITF